MLDDHYGGMLTFICFMSVPNGKSIQANVEMA